VATDKQREISIRCNALDTESSNDGDETHKPVNQRLDVDNLSPQLSDSLVAGHLFLANVVVEHVSHRDRDKAVVVLDFGDRKVRGEREPNHRRIGDVVVVDIAPRCRVGVDNDAVLTGVVGECRKGLAYGVNSS